MPSTPSNMQATVIACSPGGIFDSARQALLQLSVRVLYDAQRIRVEHIIQKHCGLTPDHAVS
jgi:hypothetical protein